MPTIRERFKNAWNVFRGKSDDTTQPPAYTQTFIDYGLGSSYRHDKPRYGRGDRNIVASIFSKIAIDVASVDIRHVKLDEQKRYVSDIESHLNECFTTSANLDQTPQAFMIDLVVSMLSDGAVAVVPTETERESRRSSFTDIYEYRVGKITQWYPEHVEVDLYDAATALHERVVVPKCETAIIENPLYEVINLPNGTMQRLMRKMAILDTIDESLSSKKLDLIIQLPYSVKSDLQKKRAEERRKDIERQLTEGVYGIAYTDGTEKITQLNRPLENNLLAQIQYLHDQLNSQLGLTDDILNGSASEFAMQNYFRRTVEPILEAIVSEFRRKFLSINARSRNESIRYFRDLFRFISVNKLAEDADKFISNRILTANEFRQILGLKPADDPDADTLFNPKLTPPAEAFEDQPYYEEQPAYPEEPEYPPNG